MQAWSLLYRAVNHGEARQRCLQLAKSPLDAKLSAFFGFEQFPPTLREFANMFVELQILRHECDYNPDYKMTKAQAQDAVVAAEAAIQTLRGEANGKIVFLAFLIHPLR